MADLTISVDINASGTKKGADEAKSAIREIKSAVDRDLKAIGRQISDFGGSMQNVGSQISSVGRTLTFGLTAPLTAAGYALFQAGANASSLKNQLFAATGSMDAANKKLVELRDLSKQSAGVLSNQAVALYGFLKPMKLSDDAINTMIKSLGRLKLANDQLDIQQFSRNLTQLFTQDFERPDLKEAVGAFPRFGEIVQQAFGLSSSDLSTVAEELKGMKAAGKLTFEQFMAGFAEGVQSDQSLSLLEDTIGTRIEKAMARIRIAFEPFGETFANGLMNIFAQLEPIIVRLGNAFSSLSPQMQQAVLIGAALVAAMGPLLVIVGGIVTAIGAFVAALGALIGSAAAVGIALAAMLGLLIQIGPLLAIVGTQVYVLYQAWQTNFAGIRDITNEVVAAVTAAWNAALTQVEAFTAEQLAKVAEWWAKHGEEIKATLAVIEAAIRERLDAIRAFWQENGDQITAIVQTVWEMIKTIISAALDNILLAIRAIAALIRGDWKTFWDATVEILGNVTKAWANLVVASQVALIQAVRTVFTGIFALRGWIEAEGQTIGIALIQGIVKGLFSLQTFLIDKAAGVIKRAVTAMQDAAKIQSPSKVTEEIGKYMAEGIGVGLDSGAAEAAKSAKELAGVITNVLGSDIGGFVRSAFDVLTDSSRSWGDRLKTIFGGIVRNFRDMVAGMASNWLSSIFGGGGQGGGMGPGGTPTFAGGGGGGFGGFRIPGDRTGTIDANGAYVVDGRSSWKKFTGPGGIFGEQGFGNNVGTFGAIGGAANMLGGAIGGRAGGFISNIGSGVALGAQIGSIIPGVGTLIGAVVGGAVGFFASLFGGDPKRKRDKKEKLPQLNQGFNDAMQQLRDLVRDVRTLRVDPDSAITRATELRQQIASGFGIQFESKKYRKQAQTLIGQRTREADVLLEELRRVAEISRAAGERQRRIIPEFAGGVFMSRDFMQQMGQFRRMNGMLPGTYRGVDTINARLAPGEMVLNPNQQARVRSNAGGDPFRGAGIPGYAGGGMAQGGGGEPLEITFVFEHTVDADGMVATSVKNSTAVDREIRLKIEDLNANDRLKNKRRGA